MSKALSILGIAVAVVLLLVFGLDLAAGVPFRGASMTMDIAFVLSSALLGYLSWSALRECI
ncbi:MAG: hypothetical protein JW809_08015 [Pirellulales bacterium]|nr:hypothetical protein [Pirellulales bacterium]